MANVFPLFDDATMALLRARQVARDPDTAQGWEIAAAINVLRRSADILDHSAADRLDAMTRGTSEFELVGRIAGRVAQRVRAMRAERGIG